MARSSLYCAMETASVHAYSAQSYVSSVRLRFAQSLQAQAEVQYSATTRRTSLIEANPDRVSPHDMIGHPRARMIPQERPLPPPLKAYGIPRTGGELPCDSMIRSFVFVSYEFLMKEERDICYMTCIVPLLAIPGDNLDNVITEHPVFSSFASSMNAQRDHNPV
jgi:hypothetical protein